MGYEYKLKPKIGVTDILLAQQSQWEIGQWDIRYTTTVRARGGSMVGMYGIHTPKHPTGLLTLGVNMQFAKPLVGALQQTLRSAPAGIAGASLMLKLYELLSELVTLKHRYILAPMTVPTAADSKLLAEVWDEAQSLVDLVLRGFINVKVASVGDNDGGIREGNPDGSQFGGGGEMPTSET
jgi:hypothetical protein